jgi:aryl sulfotransferase
MLIRLAEREYRTWSLDSRRWHRYVPRPDDIVIATAPKCGTTWTQQIVSSLVFQDAQPRPIPAVSPWIDARFRGSSEEVFDKLQAQTHRRFVKTHLPVDGLPIYDEVRYIHAARDGRDALMSMHNHFSGLSLAQLANFDRIGIDDPAIGRPYPRVPADPAAFFREWISTPAVPGQTEGTPGLSFFDLEVGYWAERQRSNFLLVHYGDLKANLDQEMRRISSFLGIAVDEEIWPTLVSAASFESMRAAGADLMPQTKTMFAEGPQRFFNKGTNGRWRNALTDNDVAQYQAKVRQKLSPSLAAWLEGGRCNAGDPRQLPD